VIGLRRQNFEGGITEPNSFWKAASCKVIINELGYLGYQGYLAHTCDYPATRQNFEEGVKELNSCKVIITDTDGRAIAIGYLGHLGYPKG